MVPFTSDVDVANAVPPDEALYHVKLAPLLPLTLNEAKVGLMAEQKVWGELAEGALVEFIVTVTARRVEDSVQPLVV